MKSGITRLAALETDFVSRLGMYRNCEVYVFQDCDRKIFQSKIAANIFVSPMYVAWRLPAFR